MYRIEDECVGCPPEIGCFGAACPNKNVIRYYCDHCDSEATLYRFEGEELCIDCLLEQFEKVEESDY